MRGLFRSISGRQRWLWLMAAFVLPLMLPLGARPAGPDFPSGYGFQWGPSHPHSSMREPLDKSEVVSAIKMFVDEDRISNQLFGAPSLLLFVDDPQRPQEISPGYGFREFEPGKSQMMLDDEGITSLSLTIAPDPAVPEAAEIADAIAQQLRDNAGFQVTVVNGDADFFVSRAIGPSAPAKPGDLSYHVTCTPDTFRPDEWTVVDCSGRIHNSTNVTLYSDTRIDRSSGITPEYSYVFAEINGQQEPVGSQDLGFATVETPAGETSDTDLLMLIKMSEGTFDAHLNVRVNEDIVAAADIHFTASKEAEDPPHDLEVRQELVDKNFELLETLETPYSDLPHDGYAIYRTTIVNRGSQPVTDLKLQARLGEVASIESDPAPAEEDLADGFARWNLSSFGKNSLQPGESLTLMTTYRPDAEDSCGQVETSAIVEATVEGKVQRYAIPDEWQTVGHCLKGG